MKKKDLKPEQLKTVIAPEGCRTDYLTPRKEYKVYNCKKSENYTFSFTIISDIGMPAICLLEKCCHLGMTKNWVIGKIKTV